MNGIGRKVTPTQAVDVVKEDPSDNRILECAAEAKSDYLVTSDKDLLRLRQFEGIPIIRVADFWS
jgi:predicted nucleic acid-binding protein